MSNISDCPPIIRKGFPKRWAAILLGKYAAGSQSGKWEDYNCVHKAWRKFQQLHLDTNLICAEYVPPEPEADNFPDLESDGDLNQCQENVGYNQYPEGST